MLLVLSCSGSITKIILFRIRLDLRGLTLRKKSGRMFFGQREFSTMNKVIYVCYISCLYHGENHSSITRVKWSVPSRPFQGVENKSYGSTIMTPAKTTISPSIKLSATKVPG